jgi:hypothetical protein
VSVKLHERFQRAVEAADAAGAEAVAGAQVVPMMVYTPRNVLGSMMGGDDGGIDTSQPVYHVEGGVCGFASIQLKAKGTDGRKFLNWITGKVRSARPASDVLNGSLGGFYRDSYYGGVSGSVRVGGQSLQRKEAYGRAFVRSLNEAGIDGLSAWMSSRMD